eukprot:gene9350-3457_t
MPALRNIVRREEAAGFSTQRAAARAGRWAAGSGRKGAAGSSDDSDS